MAQHNASHCEKTDCHVAAFGRLLAMTQKPQSALKSVLNVRKRCHCEARRAVAIRIPCIRRNCRPIGATNSQSWQNDKLKFEAFLLEKQYKHTEKGFTFPILCGTIYLVKIGTLKFLRKFLLIFHRNAFKVLSSLTIVIHYGGYIQNGTKSSVCGDCPA